MYKAYKFRIYPTKTQEEFLMKSFGCSRFIYNYGLEKKNSSYAETGKNLSLFDLHKLLPTLKLEYPWLKEANSQALQASLKNLETAFMRFFHKQAGFPNFKSRKSNLSFELPQGIKIVGSKLHIPKVKSGIKIVLHRSIEGTIKSITISKNKANQYYVSFLVEQDKEFPEKESISIESTVGIDLGIKSYATLSDGTKIENPKFLNKTLAKLKFEQRKLSLKKLGSNNRNKQKAKVAKLHNKVSNQRKNFLNQFTFRLTHENQISGLCIEDLKIKELLSEKKFSRYISDAAWYEFRRQLEYKSLWYGKTLIVIDQFNPSSKMCSKCGTINQDLKLSDRIWTCSCGEVHDRDLNAALNIKTFGLEIYRRNCGKLSLSETNIELVIEAGSSFL